MQTEQNFLILPDFFTAIAFYIEAQLQQIQNRMMQAALLRIQRVAGQFFQARLVIIRRMANDTSGMFVSNQVSYPRKKYAKYVESISPLFGQLGCRCASPIGNGLCRMRTDKVRLRS
jgi:hypothetical protein